MRNGSITHVVSQKRIRDIIYILKELLDFGNQNIPRQYRYKWGRCIVANINGLLFLSHGVVRYNKELKKEIGDFVNKNRDLLMYLIYSKRLNSIIWGVLSVLLKGNIVYAYNILYKIRYSNIFSKYLYSKL